MPRGPMRPYPAKSAQEAMKIAHGICDHNAGRPMNRVLLAQALKWSPASSGFRELIAASAKYGFTQGNYTSESIELTDLGQQLTRPRDDGERLSAMRQGFRRIPLFEQLLTHFNNNKLPAAEFLKNILEREPFNIQPEWSEEAANVFIANGRAVGFIRDVGGSPWVVIEAGPPTVGGLEGVSVEEPKLQEAKEVQVISPPVAQPPSTTLQFFIAHGRDKEPLRQLQTILNEFGIPYVVAEEEASAGRPISQKVKDLMASCSGGIFIFSADEEFKDANGVAHLRPRENVIYELGVASYLYDRRIVIFKERGVTFPSDFRDLGYIEFDKNQLAGKTMELLKELIALKAVKLLPGSS